eukprot:TRINITY_DN6041_c0_g1_i1.p1 TRINITY_DN6041_c0_g1~~TRINITY_DN6041_c0_g1_i1.p1  ORF type:complete len:346 (+),score=119.03 TRINITY_DN6041_c0_g1_i1:71-1039(+)
MLRCGNRILPSRLQSQRSYSTSTPQAQNQRKNPIQNRSVSIERDRTERYSEWKQRLLNLLHESAENMDVGLIERIESLLQSEFTNNQPLHLGILAAYQRCGLKEKQKRFLLEKKLPYETIRIHIASTMKLDVPAAMWFFQQSKQIRIPHPLIWKDIVDMFIDVNQLEHAERFLTLETNELPIPHMKEEDLNNYRIPWGKFIRALGKNGKVEEQLQALEQMRSLGLLPNLIIFNIVLGSLGNHGHVDLMLRVLSDMKTDGPQPDSSTYSAVINVLSTKDEIEKLNEVLTDAMLNIEEPQLELWGIIVQTLVVFKLKVQVESSS